MKVGNLIYPYFQINHTNIFLFNLYLVVTPPLRPVNSVSKMKATSTSQKRAAIKNTAQKQPDVEPRTRPKRTNAKMHLPESKKKRRDPDHSYRVEFPISPPADK